MFCFCDVLLRLIKQRFHGTMGKNKCSFKHKWLSTKDYSWVRQFKGDKYKVLCSICNKIFDIGSMGESALKSHMKSDKHKSCEASVSGTATGAFFVSKGNHDKERSKGFESSVEGTVESMVVPLPPTVDVPHTQARGQIASYLIKEDVSKAEILWTLRTVTAHNSNKSNEHITEIFKAMFPDSQIAAKFTCGEKMTAYMSVFGLSEHFIALLKEEVNGCFAILFDESLNKKTQQQQMDIHIRYWKDNNVVTRYLGSEFLGKFKLRY